MTICSRKPTFSAFLNMPNRHQRRRETAKDEKSTRAAEKQAAKQRWEDRRTLEREYSQKQRDVAKREPDHETAAD